MNQWLQLAGAVPVVLTYCLSLRGRLSSRAVVSLVLNMVGSGVLAYVALARYEWGFLLVEGTWSLASSATLIGVLRRRTAAGRIGLLSRPDRS